MAAATAPEPKRRPGRPKGLGVLRSKTVKFDINAAYRMLEKLANKMHLPFEWSGKLYPKTKRSHGPNQDSLNMHAEALKVLNTPASTFKPTPGPSSDLSS